MERPRLPSLHVRLALAVGILGSLLGSCSPFGMRTLEVNVDDMPVYPNAQNLTREGPLGQVTSPTGYVYAEAEYIWRFTTSDTPDAVWQFYLRELGRKWGFYQTSAAGSEPREAISNSCMFYAFSMTSKPIDSTAYSITLTLTSEYCR